MSNSTELMKDFEMGMKALMYGFKITMTALGGIEV